MKILSAYIAGALRRPLPKEVTERAKLHLLDTLAAMISDSELPPGRFALSGYLTRLVRRRMKSIKTNCERLPGFAK